MPRFWRTSRRKYLKTKQLFDKFWPADAKTARSQYTGANCIELTRQLFEVYYPRMNAEERARARATLRELDAGEHNYRY